MGLLQFQVIKPVKTNLSKRKKNTYEPANMPKKEFIKPEYTEPSLKACPLEAKVHY